MPRHEPSLPPQHDALLRRAFLRLAMVVLGIGLSACDLMYPYEAPRVETPTAYIEPSGLTGAAHWPDARWWESYQSAELNQLVTQALANNNDLAAAIARVREADASASIAGAPLLPTLQAQFIDTRSYTGNASTGVNTSGGVTTFGGSSRYRTNYNARLTAAYEIDFWGKTRSAVEAADATRDAQQYDRDVLALSISGSVTSLYFDLLATRERLHIATDNLANARKTLHALQRRFEAGLISRLDVTQQQSVVAEQQSAIAPLQLKLSQDRDALAKLLGVLPEKMPLPNATTFSDLAIPTVPAGLSSQLLARRPDIAKAEAQLVAQHANINAARAAFFPSLSLTGSGGYVSRAFSTLVLPQSELITVAGSVTQTIFDGGSLFGELDRNKARYDELTANYRQAIIAAFADTEDAFAGLQRSAEQADAQAQLVKAADDSYRLSQRQFSGGVVDITSVLNTQRSLFSARDSHVSARLQQLNATATLYQALGGGWAAPTPTDGSAAPKPAPTP